MSIYSVFEGQAMLFYVCMFHYVHACTHVCTFKCVRRVFGGSIRSISMSQEAYRQLTVQQGVCGGGYWRRRGWRVRHEGRRVRNAGGLTEE